MHVYNSHFKMLCFMQECAKTSNPQKIFLCTTFRNQLISIISQCNVFGLILVGASGIDVF